MITKSDLLAAIHKECDICVHLHGKIPEGGLDFRFTEGQRSTRDLLRYLSCMGAGFTHAMVTGDWTPYSSLAEESASLAAEDFPAAMEAQKANIAEVFETFTDEELASREAVLPTGETVTLGRALIDMPLRCLVGYRMQLFLQAKAAGNADIKTPNCWAGVDLDD